MHRATRREAHHVHGYWQRNRGCKLAGPVSSWAPEPTQVSGATITGNVFNDHGGGSVPLDLLSIRKPKFVGTCDHSASVSRDTGDLVAWGCSGD